jgi:hypothetical protein
VLWPAISTDLSPKKHSRRPIGRRPHEDAQIIGLMQVSICVQVRELLTIRSNHRTLTKEARLTTESADPSVPVHEGGCLCGAARYRVVGSPLRMS